ncbi:SDR family NAD(P)-dependent oxidoreductase [Paenibacillus arenilitoris]|uniref:Glucose 1-dehydrogenase n=1 Tax=Paenibacillus arenilitoris TaxID=2772299 RepID=A0A927H6W2_9BACL|nr:glucose 1-dehydrogenase [Paenibacillus arenilitoris]MBD2869912.1 glucose 1-dehydrogenase [Paenibacillus arenilitoris]
MSIAGKIALVTGAGTGIGQGVAVELARRGAKVAVHYNRSDAGARNTLSRIESIGGEGCLVQADVARKEDIDRMAEAVADRFGGIDVLVNNAALQLNYDFFEHDEDSFDRMMNINLKGYLQCIQAVVPYMKTKRSGRIIVISSVHSKRPTDFDAVYAMTKGGIRMLARESAIELAKYGITVNAIEPGAVDVGKQSVRESKPILSEEERERQKHARSSILDKFPLGRVGKPLDVANLVAFIASDESEFMTGSSIRLDGGSMLL